MDQNTLAESVTVVCLITPEKGRKTRKKSKKTPNTYGSCHKKKCVFETCMLKLKRTR